jgi:hypothetical protein
MFSTITSCQPLVLISKSEQLMLMEKPLNYKFGIQLVKKDLRPSLAVIIRELMVLLSPMISPIENLSQRFQSG